MVKPLGRFHALSGVLGGGAAGVLDPDRHGLADDRGGRERPEIPPVQAVWDGPVHQEDLTPVELAAAAPARQEAAQMVAVERGPGSDAVDGDGIAPAADRLTGQRRDMLQEGHATRQEAATG